MSNTSPEPVFDLEQHFLPAWAKKAPEENRYADYRGEPERPDRNRDRSDRPPRRRDQPRDRSGAEARPPGTGRPSPFQGRRDQRFRDDRRPRDQQPRRDQPAAPPAPLPEINVAFVPDEKGVESLARQIRMTGRAYPVFEIAQMILAKPERHSVTFSSRKQPDGSALQPLYLCALDETLWLAEEEAAHHLLDHHFTTFYQPERTQVEPPKGVYTFVAQCGLSGVILGPPNHHDYQANLRKLHVERFARMPFEAFKARVKIVRDEAVVKKWIEDQSWKTQYVCLNMPEPLKFATREEVEKHFREVHLANLIQKVEVYRLSGAASRNLRDFGLRRLVRLAWEDQRRFPMQVAAALSQQFAAAGLQFFKVNKSVTHVSVARPHYLDLEITPVSENIKRIVNFINEHAKCTHNQLLEALAPMPGKETAAEPTPERTAVNADLHWLVHQGHVIEFASGVLETAKRPLPRPPKPASVSGEPPAAPGEVTPGLEPAAMPAPPAEPSREAPELASAPAPEPATPSAEVPAPAEAAASEAAAAEQNSTAPALAEESSSAPSPTTSI